MISYLYLLRFMTLLSLILVLFLAPATASAIVAPDFVFNVGAQVAQAFSFILIVVTAIGGAFIQFLRSRFGAFRHLKSWIMIALGGAILLAIGLSSLYGRQLQKREFGDWITDSGRYNNLSSFPTISAESPNLPKETTKDPADQLEIGSVEIIDLDLSSQAFVSLIDPGERDAHARFIETYYRAIAEHRLDDAYALSKQSADSSTFRQWYEQTSKITLDHLVRIDAQTSSVELTLYEGQTFTRYGVLLSLLLKGDEPQRIESSSVKILSGGRLTEKQNAVENASAAIEEAYDFFEQTSSTPLSITNTEFQKQLDEYSNDLWVLDAREDLEYENGSFPGSHHIRFADLKAGKWIEVPHDRVIIVLCWSGIRGKEVTEFLRAKRLVARFLEKGANGWVAEGGRWDGNTEFGKTYSADRFRKVFTTQDVRRAVSDGALLVDARQPEKYQYSHISGTANIAMMYTPTLLMDSAFAQLPPEQTVITVCDDYVNCFDAKIVGVELEKRGHQFLGRYNRPWEYE